MRENVTTRCQHYTVLIRDSLQDVVVSDLKTVSNYVNLAAGVMHLLRAAGIYFGDARPVTSRGFERKAGFVHVFSLLALFITLPGFGLLN